MAGSVPLVDGGEGGKTASDTGDGRRALNSTKPVPPDAGQGGLRGRLTAPQPAGGGVTPAWAQHHPRGTRSCDKRRPEHSVGWRCWLAGEQGTHPDRLAEPQPRRIEATRGQGRCPKVSRGRRAAARRPPSLRTRPCLARRAKKGSPPAATWSARVPHQQVLQQPTSRVGSRHAARAAATRRDRHQRQPATLLRYPALVGCRVTQHLAARAPAGLRIDRRRRDRDSHAGAAGSKLA